MKRAALLLVAAAVAVALPSALTAQAKSYALESSQGLTLHNVSAVPAVLLDKKGVKVTLSDEAAQRLRAMPADQQAPMEQLALIDGVDFDNGTIEAEIAGAPAPGAAAGARGFVGIAFRVQKDLRTYDAFYLRPTNGRADDQERRNHAVQYIAHPDWPWFRLRKETPSRYEAYADLLPGVWTKVKIDVRGDKARLFVNDAEQPTLLVNDLKSGATGRAPWRSGSIRGRSPTFATSACGPKAAPQKSLS